jgi:peroxiredoxin
MEFAPMRKWFLSIAAVALVAGTVFAAPGKYNKVVSVGEKAPAFSGIPAVIGDQDASLTLSDLKEDVVVLVFLNNACPYVTAVEDRLIDFANDYKGKSVKLVGVSVVDASNHRLPNIKEHVKKRGENFVYGYDESQAIGKAYGATNTPQFFVLDKDRVIRYTGAMDDSPTKEDQVKKRYVRDAVDALLAGKAIPESEQETKAVGCGVGYKR